MFQYAFALNFCKRLGAELFVTYNHFDRSYGLDIFGIQLSKDLPHCDKEIVWEWGFQEGIVEHLISQTEGCDAVRLVGYFQDERFFAGVEEEIRAAFTLPSLVLDDTAVGIHVRLGDYRHPPLLSALPPSYYQEAVAWCRENLDSPRFHIFSDEPDHCASIFTDSDVTLTRAEEESALSWMSSCHHMIAANSTFSWWGAWLGEKGTVICPSPMFSGIDWQIFPDRWQKQPVDWSQVNQSEQWLLPGEQ
jgi:hypothetical protein